MKVYKLEVENFRLLKKFSIDLENELSLVIGKNNTGKTSILSVLDKFINEKSKFSYDDLNIDFKNELESLIKSADVPDEFSPKGIKLKIYIEYNDTDDLSNVSRVLMDLDPDNNNIVLGFEYTVSYDAFLKIKADYAIFAASENAKNAKKKEYKPRELKDFLKKNIEAYYKIHKFSFEYDTTANKITETKPIDLVS